MTAILPEGWIPSEEGPRGGGMIIGMAPHVEEVKAGRPFVGKAGTRLRAELADLGYGPGDLHIANVVRFFPRNAPNVEDDEVDACLPSLVAEIREVQPKAILALGHTAFETLTGMSAAREFTSCRGDWQRIAPAFGSDRIPVLPTWHPSYFDRGGIANIDIWRGDLAKFVAAL